MANKADVKAIMARFQAGGTTSEEEASPTPMGRPRPQLQPTLSSGPPMPAKKPALESISGSAVQFPLKPTSLKGTRSTSSAPEHQEPTRAKALASKFSHPQEHSNSNSKPFGNTPFPLKTSASQDNVIKAPKPLLQKSSLASVVPESKPAILKPSQGPHSSPKPSWVKADSGDSATPKVPPVQQKPSSAITKLKLQSEDASPDNKSQAPASRGTPNFQAAHHVFNKDSNHASQSDESPKEQGTKVQHAPENNSTPPHRPLANKKPSIVRKLANIHQITSTSGDADPAPPHNTLPNTLVLGPAPAKPNRPPKVNLEGLKMNADTSDSGSGTVKKPPLASNPSNNTSPPLPSNIPAPSLPPRHPAATIQPEQEEENYDDVGVMNVPPPLPPSTAHPSQRAKEQSDESDGDTYEDLDQQWEETERKQHEKKKEKDEREEKKRLEAEKKEKKEQKEREKKEQEAKKKFKITGPLEVLHKATAVADSKASKTDLALKQGDLVDIVRLHGNPEGKWLGRTQDGSYGYVKTSSVEIELKKGEYEPDVYDDIDVAPNETVTTKTKGPGVVLPPPVDVDGEIYDDVIDPNLDIRLPPPSKFSTDGNSEPVDEEIYDDVDSHPPPPPFSSAPVLKAKLKMEEIDPKKQKKFEKEEKDFRKKFKYEGEIQVLYEVTTIPTLNIKKWSGKDLPIKPGEKLDVMVKAVDNKLICRNEDGKFGYVSTSHIATDDGDIYDDIGDDSIYDND